MTSSSGVGAVTAWGEGAVSTADRTTVPRLLIKDICKAYPGVQALDHVSLEFRAGEIHALLGQNGAGKSTLIKILSGAEVPDAGVIQLEGRTVHFTSPSDALHAGIATIYQELSVLPNLTVAENVFIGALPHRGRLWRMVDWARMRTEAARWLRELGFEVDPDWKVGELSVAEQQVVEIAKALHRKARILLLDEPSAALPPRDVQRLLATLRKLKERGVTCIYISHRFEEIAAVCDRASILRDGQRIGTYNARETTVDHLMRLMLGRRLHEAGEPQTLTLGTGMARRSTPEAALSVLGLNVAGKLHNVHLTVHAGEVTGITGLVGSGQAVLARSLFGAQRIDAGVIRVNGREVRFATPQDAVRAGLGFLPADRKNESLVLGMSVRANISLASLKRLSQWGVIDRRREANEVAHQVAALSIKTPGIEAKAVGLSGGNQQKVVLAKWMASKAKILIFEEPTRGIDVGAKEQVYQLIRQFVRDGGTVLLISSELNEAMMCDRVYVMARGTIVGEFTRDEIDPHGEVILSLCR